MLKILHVPIGHLYVFFGEMSVWVFCSFSQWVVCLFFTIPCSMWDPVSQLGIEPMPPVVEAWSFNRWTTREVLEFLLLLLLLTYMSCLYTLEIKPFINHIIYK